MNSSTPRFVLPPWEFEGYPHTPLADATAECRWQGEQTTMRLKVRENLLFFAPTGCDDRLFALSVPLEQTVEPVQGWRTRPQDLQRRFETEYARNRWGRIVTLIGSDTCKIALINSAGTGWVGPLFGDHLIKVNSKKALSEADTFIVTEHEDILRQMVGAEWKSSIAALSRREISVEARKRAHISPLWISGSLRELKEGLEAAATIFPPVDSSNGIYYPTLFVYARTAVRASRLWWRVGDPTPPLERITDLLLQIHVCIGQSLDERGHFFQPYFVVDIEDGSMHDRMEAMLRLRDATRNTRIEAEIREILEQVRL